VLAVIAATQPLLAFPYGTIPLFVVLGAGIAVAEGASSPRRGLVSARHAPRPTVAARDR
jgi:hypothetical protein